MIQLVGTVSKSWMADAIGVTFDRDYYFDPVLRHAVDSRCHAYLAELLGDLNLFFTESNLGRREHHDSRHALVGGIQPNMILGMLVGADFVPHDRMDADISPTPLAAVEPRDLPSSEALLEHPIVKLFDDQLRCLGRKNHGELVPVPPLFWDDSGRAAIHGSLTTAQKLFGESILADTITNPQRADAILQWATDVSVALVRHYAELAGREITEVHVGECSACMVSAEAFERFVVPSLSRFGRELGPVRLHSCGTSDHLLPTCQKIENLSSLDIGGGTSVSTVRELFGLRFPVDIAPLTDDLRASRPDSLLAWLQRVVSQNAGGPMTIVFHLEKGYSLGHVRAIQTYQ